MRVPFIRSSLLATTLALAGCTSNADDASTCRCANPQPSLQTSVGDELEADLGTMRLTVEVAGPGVGTVSIDVSSHSSSEDLQAAFGQTLSFEEAKELVAGKTVELDGAMAIKWGEYGKEVSRPIERMSLERDGEGHGDGSVTLTLGLGEYLFAMNDADVDRFGAAREASFTGPLSIGCYAQELVDDPTFSTDGCKQAADSIGLWPLLSR